jgi:hypothetical protein
MRFGLVGATYPPSIHGDQGITWVRCLIQFVILIGAQCAAPLPWQAGVIPSWGSGSVSGSPVIHPESANSGALALEQQGHQRPCVMSVSVELSAKSLS